VTQALVGPDLHLAADVGLHLAAQVTFHLEAGIDLLTQRENVLVGQVLGPQIRADAGRDQEGGGTCAADPVDVGQGYFHPLVAGKINTHESCHSARYSFGCSFRCRSRPVPVGASLPSLPIGGKP
jgi:hypothetical protein